MKASRSFQLAPSYNFSTNLRGVITKSEFLFVIKLENLERLEEFQKDYNFLVIQFSASWCNPCKKITPEMIKWASQQKTKDVVYLDKGRAIFCKEASLT